jgi:acetylornithine/succinyldiaminopimelate/putrescine aminotransferase
MGIGAPASAVACSSVEESEHAASKLNALAANTNRKLTMTYLSNEFHARTT